MLRLSSINFNQTSKNNKSSNYQQNSQLKRNSMPMKDTVSFGMAEKVVKPVAQNVQKIMGHDFIPNVQFHTWYTNTKLLTLKKATTIATKMNANVETMTKELTSYKPEHLKQWVKRLLETKHINIKVTAGEHLPDSEQFGKNEAYVKNLYGAEDNKKNLGSIIVRKLSNNSPNSEYVAFDDHRVGIEMKEYLINGFKNKNKNISVEIEGEKHLIQSSDYGINILQLEEI